MTWSDTYWSSGVVASKTHHLIGKYSQTDLEVGQLLVDEPTPRQGIAVRATRIIRRLRRFAKTVRPLPQSSNRR